jgi:hypothetical protein
MGSDMREIRVTELSRYQHWLKKAEHELRRYEESRDVYDLANTLLTLNALPEWIEMADGAPAEIKNLAAKKIRIMKDHHLDESRLHEIDHQLRLVRLFCNHAKHGEPKEKLSQITMSAPFPLTFPVRFDHMQIGTRTVEMLPILKSLVSFWSDEIKRHEDT